MPCLMWKPPLLVRKTSLPNGFRRARRCATVCAVLSAKLMGATRIISMSRHTDRQEIAKKFGATDFVEERGDEAVAKVLEMTDGYGADAVLECG